MERGERILLIKNDFCCFTVAIFLANHTNFFPQIISPINSVGMERGDRYVNRLLKIAVLVFE